VHPFPKERGLEDRQTEILLKVELNTKIQIQILSFGHDNVCPSSIYGI
jgi:hypothetical protein